jgi:hypothetical protein
MKQILKIGLFLAILFGLYSCIPGMVDKIPQVHISIKNDSKVEIDSLCLVEDTISSISQCYKISDFKQGINDYWFTDTFNVLVYYKNGLILKSNKSYRKTYDDYYDLIVTDKSLILNRTGDSVLVRYLFVLFILILVSLILKTLPSLIFIKPTNKIKYLILSTLLNLGYWLFIIGFLVVVARFKTVDIFTAGLLLIIIMVIVDSIIFGLLFGRKTSVVKLISCILLTNLLFYICGVQLMIWMTLFVL